MDSLIKRRTIIVDADTSYAACLLCDTVATKRMLCDSHYATAQRENWLWKFPGNYLDDYSDEGQDEIDAIICWLFEFNFFTLVSVMAERGDMEVVSLSGGGARKNARRGLSDEGYPWADPENGLGCYRCNNEGKLKARGLCEKCYLSIRDDELDSLLNYPTSKYTSNIKGHAWFMLEYHADRVIQIGASDFGVVLSVKNQR